LAGNWNNNFGMSTVDENRAVLGVTTEKDAKGTQIKTITKDGGAEKAGLKKGDIITKIDDTKIEEPDDLSAAIRKHKPGDNVTVAYIRDGKEQTVKAVLGKWKGINQTYSLSMPNMNFDVLPRIQSRPRVQGQNWNWSGGSPKLGMFVQDDEDGKGVKVIEVDEDGNASKAGIKEDDVITEVDGKPVTDADQVAKIIQGSKDKISVKIKLIRKGKTENIDVKMPRRLKTADL
jgi:serine protease Do